METPEEVTGSCFGVQGNTVVPEREQGGFQSALHPIQVFYVKESNSHMGDELFGAGTTSPMAWNP